MQNSIFEPLFGKKSSKLFEPLSDQEENLANPKVNFESTNHFHKQLADLPESNNKIKLIWLALIIILLIIVSTLIKNPVRRRKNPKRLSRFVKASKKETLEG